MGSFADFYQARNCCIQAHKQEEFEQRAKQVFHAGGMMELDDIYLQGKRITLIKPIELRENGFRACYNYFDDSFWEDAGYSKKNAEIWSNKVGGSFFTRSVLGAYRLQEHYMEGTCATLLNGELILGGGYIGWLNYLFNEKYLPKNHDPWKLFESCHYANEMRNAWDYIHFYHGYSFIGCCEIHAVLRGTDFALTKYDSAALDATENLSLKAMKQLLPALQTYSELSEQDRETQLRQLMNMLRTYYETGTPTSEEPLKLVCALNDIADAPAFTVKAISELYNRDFWELWSEIREVARRTNYDIYQSKQLYVQPISTSEFFGLSPDDMIFYWENNNDIVFSDDLWNWFKELKLCFDRWMDTDLTLERPLSFILNLMSAADSTYYRIYTFSQFFEETLEHLQDKQYLVLWKMYEEMIFDPELKTAGMAIYENGKFASYSWDWMNPERKYNKGRMTLRRYMALMANQPLRKKIFGV